MQRTEKYQEYMQSPRRKRLQRNSQLVRLYGITIKEYESMLSTQGGICALCPQPAAAVDHDHDSGKVRGLLCHNCNTALGKFNDDPARLRAAANYLEESSR